MRKVLVAMLFALVLVLPVLSQQDMNAEGSSRLTVVLNFSEKDVSIALEGGLTLSGSVDLDGDTINFSADGTTFGSGVSETATLATIAWTLIDVAGTTEGGTPILIRGGLTAYSSETDLTTLSLGSGCGLFFFVFKFPVRLVYVSGDAEGTGTGTFVPPDDPLTMQVEGTGILSFRGNVLSVDVAEEAGSEEEALLQALPWELSGWPEDLLGELVELIRNGTQEGE